MMLLILKKLMENLLGHLRKLLLECLEVRGIGIIDITALYGLSSIVQESKGINLVNAF